MIRCPVSCKLTFPYVCDMNSLILLIHEYIGKNFLTYVIIQIMMYVLGLCND